MKLADTGMTSEERIIAAMLAKNVDYTPCCPVWWTGAPSGEAFVFDSEVDQLDFTINHLGLDATLEFAVQTAHVDMRSWIEERSGESYPWLHSGVETPKGTLHAVIRKTADYDERVIPFFSDWTVSRYVKPWVETMEDVEKFATVFAPPDAEQLDGSKEHLERLRRLAGKWGVAIIGDAGMSMDAVLYLMGTQQGVLASIDKPAVIEALLNVIHSVNRTTLEMMLAWGVKVVVRRGWYDSTDFWSPAQFRKWVMPQLKSDIEVTHQAGAIFIYQACTGIQPLLPLFGELGFDCFLEPEPVLGGLDMRELKAALPGKSFWGGVSAPIHIGRGKPEVVRKAVQDAFAAFGHRGFILKAVPSIRKHWPWENVLAMIDEWKRLRGSGLPSEGKNQH